MQEVEFGYSTHVRLVRGTNEDSYLAAPEIGLCVVADGMGGTKRERWPAVSQSMQRKGGKRKGVRS